MKSRKKAAAVVLVVALTVLSLPVVGVTTSERTLSEHTTETDFNNAVETQSLVVTGSGENATLGLDTATILEDFETTTVSGDFNGDTGAFDINSGEAYTGSNSLEAPASSNTNIIYNPDTTVSAGETYTYRQYISTSDESAGLLFGMGTGGSETGYLLQVNANQDRMRIFKGDGGGYPDQLGTYNVQIPENEWLNSTLEWSDGGTSTWTLEDANGNQLGQLSFSDNGYTSGTIGYRRFSGGVRWDAVTKEGGGDVSNATYVSQTHTADVETAGIEFSGLSSVTANVEWQYNDGSGWATFDNTSYTTPGDKTIDISGQSATDWRVKVTVDNVGSTPTMDIERDYVNGQVSHPEIDNTTLSPTGTLQDDVATFTVDVSDGDFGRPQGEELNASLYINGQYEGSDILTSNGTASVTATVSGQSDYWWVVEDKYGTTTQSETTQITTPAQLYIFNETRPHDLVTGVDAEVTITGAGETVNLETVDDGTVQLGGLPTGDNYVFTINAPGYYPREVYVDNLFEEQSVYLLPESTPSVQNRITITDRTGEYDTGSIVVVDRVINTSTISQIPDNGTQWTTMGGDRLGTSGFYAIDLEEYGRYRFRVINEQGDSRVLGEYTAKSAGTVDLKIGSISYSAGPGDNSYEWDASYTNVTGGNYSVSFAYNDHEDLTTALEATIKTRDNGTVLGTQTFTNTPYGEAVYTIPVNQTVWDNNDIVVDWEATRDGETISGKRLVSGTADMDYPIDDLWKTVAFAAGVLILAFLVGAGAGPAPALITVGMFAAFGVYIGLAPAALGFGATILVVTMGAVLTAKRGARPGV